MNRQATLKTGIAATTLIIAAGANASGTSADEVRAIVAEMFADAETRTSLQQSPGAVGHDGKFFVSSADDRYRLEISGQTQFRYMATFRDNDAGIDDSEAGFQLRRTKLTFAGHVLDDLEYEVTGAFSRAVGLFVLENAFVRTKLGDDGWFIKWGQFKEAFLREQSVSSKRQLMVDRSNVNNLFGQGFSQAVELQYKNDQINVLANFSDGFGSSNTDYNTGPAEYSMTGRFEWLALGEWEQFKDFTSRRGSEDALMLAAALHFEESQRFPGISDQFETLSYTLEASWESDGWNAFAYFVGRSIDTLGGVSDNPIDTYGAVVQGGCFITEDWELIGRYDQFFNDDDFGDDFTTVTLGANYYMKGHAAKFTFDVQWSLDDIAGTGGLVRRNTGIGLLGSGAEGDEITFRAQFQLLF